MMEYLVVNSNMFRSPSGTRGVMSMEKENESASRCGAMNKNANSTGTDPQAYHSFAKNDEEKGILVPEKKSNDEKKFWENPLRPAEWRATDRIIFYNPDQFPQSSSYGKMAHAKLLTSLT